MPENGATICLYIASALLALDSTAKAKAYLIQSERLVAHQQPQRDYAIDYSETRARRRLGAWLGLLHGWVIWFGDLLHLYGLLGFTLVYFVRQSPSTLLKWIAGLVGFVVLIQIIQYLVVPHSPPALAAPGQSVGALMSPFVNTWQYGSFLEVMRLQSAGWLLGRSQAVGQRLALYVQLEILLLVGLLVGKMVHVDRPAELRVRLSLLLVFLFPLAIGLKGVSSLLVVESPPLPAR